MNQAQWTDGSTMVAIVEKSAPLCSLAMDSNAAPNPGKRRRVRHQHFWRNSDKLPPEHRLYVTSADIKLALEQVCAAGSMMEVCSVGLQDALSMLGRPHACRQSVPSGLEGCSL